MCVCVCVFVREREREREKERKRIAPRLGKTLPFSRIGLLCKIVHTFIIPNLRISVIHGFF